MHKLLEDSVKKRSSVGCQMLQSAEVSLQLNNNFIIVYLSNVNFRDVINKTYKLLWASIVGDKEILKHRLRFLKDCKKNGR